jgi:hypothetical protein
MAYSEQWNGYVAIKAQGAKGTPASGAGALLLGTSGGQGGQLTKQSINSNIVRQDGQQLRGRHGSRRTTGVYNSELAIGRADPIWQAIMRSTYSAADLTITQVDMTSVTTTTSTIVAASGDWIAKGLRVGDVIRATGLPDAANNGPNLRIVGLTSSVITVAETLIANASPDTSFSIVRPGRILINGAAGAMTRTYFTIEEYEYDLDSSEVFSDARWTRAALRMQSDGLLDTEYGWTGTGAMSTATGASAPVFTSPTDVTTLSLAATEATIRLGSTDVVDITSFDIAFDLQPNAPSTISPGGLAPDVFTGIFQTSMNLTMLRKDLQALADFSSEAQFSLHVMGQENSAAPTAFFSVFVPNFTLGSVAKSALSKAGGARTVTIGVPAELVGKDTRGGAYDATMVKLQVSNAT